MSEASWGDGIPDSRWGNGKCKGPKEGRSPCVLEQLGWTEAREVVGAGGMHREPLEPLAGWQFCCWLSGACPGGCVQLAEAGGWP